MTSVAQIKSLPIDSNPEQEMQSKTEAELKNRTYFDSKKVLANTGIAETPHDLVLEMVRESIRELDTHNKTEIRWLDPCAGTGAFPLGIIEEYLGSVKDIGYDRLPLLTAVELDHEAIAIMLMRIDEKLSQHGLTLDGYINCGRFLLHHIDFFEFVHSNLVIDGGSEKFDVAIGNPPYLKSRLIPVTTRDRIDAVMQSRYSKSADLYAHFYSASWRLLSSNGALSFITPHNFLKSPSCRWMREQIEQNGHLASIIDLGERPIFSGISIHSGIFTFRKQAKANDTFLVDLSGNLGTFTSAELKQSERQPVHFQTSSDSKWVINHRGHNATISSRSTSTLEDCGYKIYSGIRTGLTAAYILTSSRVNEFSLEDDPAVHRILVPTDIGKSLVTNPQNLIINLPRGCEPPSSAILSYLEPFRSRLIARTEFPSLKHWYEQRSIAYIDKMMKRKIAFPDIGVSPQFALVEENILIADGAYFIDTDDLAVLALLRSSFALQYFSSHSPTIGSVSARGRLRLKKHVVRSFPMPPNWSTNSAFNHQLRDLMIGAMNQSSEANKNEKLIDQLIYEEYKIRICPT